MGERTAHCHVVRPLQEVVQAVRADEFVEIRWRIIGVAAEPNDAHAQMVGLPGQCRADAAHANHTEGLPFQTERMKHRRTPHVLALRQEDLLKVPRKSQHHGQHVLGNLRRVQTLRIRHNHVRRNQFRRQQTIDTGARTLNPLQIAGLG